MIKRNIWIAATALLALIASGVVVKYFGGPSAYEISASALTRKAPDYDAQTDVFAPLPVALALDERKVELGRRLFHDPRLSADGTISCAHCHNLETGGVDRLVRSIGIGGRQGVINAPTVYNSGFNFRQFWDGHAATLEDQIDGPIQNPVEMGNTWPHVLATIANDTQYVTAFKSIYPDGITRDNVKDAIATFERSLITPNSRFDRFLRGDKTALNDKEFAGYTLFMQVGCASCHQGINIGGNIYQKLGIMEDYFAARGHVSDADYGRFNVTKREEDRYFFKVPSLRNVAVTPPYLHDGSVQTLAEAVKVMARFQLGTQLTAEEVDNIVAFLHTLTGEYSGKPLQ